MSTPSMRIWPDVGSMSRLTILRLVVLPQPDGPTRTQILPAGTVSDRSLTAPGVPFSRGPYTFVTYLHSTAAPRVDEDMGEVAEVMARRARARARCHARR